MAKKRKRHEHFNQVPKYCTGDMPDGSCMIYEMKNELRGMGTIEALFSAVKLVRYDGTDAIVEDPRGANSMILELRTGSLLPNNYNGMALTWYEHEDDPNNEITLEEIITMCAI